MGLVDWIVLKKKKKGTCVARDLGPVVLPFLPEFREHSEIPGWNSIGGNYHPFWCK